MYRNASLQHLSKTRSATISKFCWPHLPPSHPEEPPDSMSPRTFLNFHFNTSVSFNDSFYPLFVPVTQPIIFLYTPQNYIRKFINTTCYTMHFDYRLKLSAYLMSVVGHGEYTWRKWKTILKVKCICCLSKKWWARQEVERRVCQGCEHREVVQWMGGWAQSSERTDRKGCTRQGRRLQGGTPDSQFMVEFMMDVSRSRMCAGDDEVVKGEVWWTAGTEKDNGSRGLR